MGSSRWCPVFAPCHLTKSGEPRAVVPSASRRSFNIAVALRFADAGWRRVDAQETDLLLEVAAHGPRSVIMAELETISVADRRQRMPSQAGLALDLVDHRYRLLRDVNERVDEVTRHFAALAFIFLLQHRDE